MSKITVTPDEFVDFVISFLLNKMIHKKEMLGDNERFNDIVERMERGGLKSHLLQAFLKFDSQQRMQFKRIKDVFEGKDNVRNTIDILPDRTSKEKAFRNKGDNSFLNEIIKRVIKEARSYRIRTGCLISNDKMERLIDKVLTEEYNKESK
jgi:hypothetical protein